jgi:hypothetical protein
MSKPKSKAQLDREIATALRAYPDARTRSHLEDAIESVYDRKGSEDLTLAEACEAVRELLPSSASMGLDTSDKAIGRLIRVRIPNWF